MATSGTPADRTTCFASRDSGCRRLKSSPRSSNIGACWRLPSSRLRRERDCTRLKAFVVLREGYDGTAELVKELQDFVKQRITPYKYPRRVEFLGRVAQDGRGKTTAIQASRDESFLSITESTS